VAECKRCEFSDNYYILDGAADADASADFDACVRCAVGFDQHYDLGGFGGGTGQESFNFVCIGVPMFVCL